MDPFWVQLDDRADGAGQGERGIKMNSDLCSCKGVTWKNDYRLSRWGVETGPCSDCTEWGHSSVGSKRVWAPGSPGRMGRSQTESDVSLSNACPALPASEVSS